MKSKNLRMTLLSVTVIALALGGLAFASGHAGPDCSHGRIGHHMAMMQLIDELDLSDQQQQHVESVHETLMSQRHQMQQIHGQGIDWMLSAVERGEVDGEEVREKLDAHAEQFRHVAYLVSDELVALFNSLSDEQRAVVAEHLQKVKEKGGSHGMHHGF